MVRVLILLSVCASVAACEPAKPHNPALRHAAKAPAKAPVRKCPDINNRDRNDPCSASYIAPYKPTFNRKQF
jgi:hypothetical protein